MLTVAKLKLGRGFDYFTGDVIRGDGAAGKSTPLTRYYEESGTPPGKWMGRGIFSLGNPQALIDAGQVTDEHLHRILTALVDPSTGEQWGRKAAKTQPSLVERLHQRYLELPRGLSGEARKQAEAAINVEEFEREKKIRRDVAAWDFTLSLTKSASAMWANADARTQQIIYDAHQDAASTVLSFAEDHVFFTRAGADGKLQVKVTGVVAAGFDHWDSRAGDPQLHKHILIANRAYDEDGAARALDGQVFLPYVVALSEMHNGIFMDLLTARLGVGWDRRKRAHSDNVGWEIAGVPDDLNAEYSQRARQVDAIINEKVEQFIATFGRRPTGSELHAIRGDATLLSRPSKQHRTLSEQMGWWRERGRPYIGQDTEAWANQLPLRVGAQQQLDSDNMQHLAGEVLDGVQARRATFSEANVLAQTHRVLHRFTFADPAQRLAAAAQLTAAVLDLADVQRLTPPEMMHTPRVLRNSDGTSRTRHLSTIRYTTNTLLDAEDRLLDSSAQHGAARVEPTRTDRILVANLPGRDYGLAEDQASAVRQIAASGRRLDLLVGPAGTGKTTTMAGLRAVWEDQYGEGSVLGLAKSANAAEVLGDELGIGTENIDKWLFESTLMNAERRSERHALQTVAITPQQARSEMDRLRAEMRRAEQAGDTDLLKNLRHSFFSTAHFRSADARAKRITELEEVIGTWTMYPNQLVIVDEASMAGTLALDRLLGQVEQAGAKLLLVGDYAQLGGVEAGGAFRMLVKARGDRDGDAAPELTSVRRFRNEWEAAASLRIRAGNERGLEAYLAHDRVIDGDRETMIERLYRAWKTDTDDGRLSLMIAGDLATVSTLNRRARAERIAVGEVQAQGIALPDGETVGIGDRVFTRRNNRRLRTGGDTWVKNGDSWIITAISDEGALTVQRERARGGTVTLPADYVQQHVHLGYAVTANRAQGATVDTAHAMVSPTTTREVLYVTTTRGRDGNYMYVDTCYDPNPDTSHGPAEERDVIDVLAGVLRNIGGDLSAHDTRELIEQKVNTVREHTRIYGELARRGETDRWVGLLTAGGLTPDQVTATIESESYGALTTALRTAAAHGINIDTLLPAIIRERGFADAEDVGSVLHQRVDNHTAHQTHGKPAPDGGLIVGLIPTAAYVTDDDIQLGLDDRKSGIEYRAWLALLDAAKREARWVTSLGPAPQDPALRHEWTKAAMTVAAYLELTGHPTLSLGSVRDEAEMLLYQRADHARDTARSLAQEDLHRRPAHETELTAGALERPVSQQPAGWNPGDTPDARLDNSYRGPAL